MENKELETNCCGRELPVSKFEKLVCGKSMIDGRVWMCDDCLNK